MDRNALFKWTKEQFGTDPEYLWARYPGYAVLRNGGNRKWYALIMDVPRGRLECLETGPWILWMWCGLIVSGSLRRGTGVPSGIPYESRELGQCSAGWHSAGGRDQRLIELSYELTALKQKRASGRSAASLETEMCTVRLARRCGGTDKRAKAVCAFALFCLWKP